MATVVLVVLLGISLLFNLFAGLLVMAAISKPAPKQEKKMQRLVFKALKHKKLDHVDIWTMTIMVGEEEKTYRKQRTQWTELNGSAVDYYSDLHHALNNLLISARAK